jgi:hypothetical protein
LQRIPLNKSTARTDKRKRALNQDLNRTNQ